MRVKLQNPGNVLRPGMFAHIDFTLSSVKAPVAIPKEAVQQQSAPRTTTTEPDAAAAGAALAGGATTTTPAAPALAVGTSPLREPKCLALVSER